MTLRIKKGTVIGAFEVRKSLRRDAVFCWVAAVEQHTGREVVLQVLTPGAGLTREETDAMQAHFRDLLTRLQGFKKPKRLLVPERIVTNADYPLVAVYPECPQDTLQDWLGKDYEAACGCWEQAAESIRSVHTKTFVHGHLTPESFVVADDRKVYLANFGYAPVLEAGHRNALREISDFLAPELSRPHNLMKESDIYAFAKTLAAWEPRVASEDWYKQATDRDPKKRFNGMSAMFPEIERTLTAFVATEDDAATKETGSEEVPERGRGSGLRRRLHLITKVSPSRAAGDVAGAGRFQRSESGEAPEAQVEAKPKPGWRFARWEGGLSGTKNPASVVLEGDMTVTAHFEKVPHVLLKAKIQPRGRGSVDGDRPYGVGDTATVQAYPDEGWRFDHWSGALSGSGNPAEVSMNASKVVTAHFVRETGVTSREEGGRVTVAAGSPWVVLPLCGGSTVAVGLWAAAVVDLRVAAIAAAGSALLAVGAFLTRLVLGGGEE